ncbi:MAG TPA: gliding motility-associated C-terminal domain-containing protein, partial [Bacteroidales bacterium]|nr:gliding motility-associated C-terminal domain-containing protein [Bacteroidales bacterium]
NDRFKAFEFTSVERINLIIFNRWGRIVYQTTDPWFQWDGKNQQNNRNCSEGVYFYVCDVFEIQLEGLTKRTIKGSITLLR